MNDTPFHILKKQFEICYTRSLKDKLSGLFELTELSRHIIENRIKEKTPEISELELKIKLFKCFYKQDFKEEKLNEIAESMKRFYFLLLSFFFYLLPFTFTVSAQPVSITGKATTYAGQVIEALIYDDYISNTEKYLAKAAINDGGSFELTEGIILLPFIPNGSMNFSIFAQ